MRHRSPEPQSILLMTLHLVKHYRCWQNHERDRPMTSARILLMRHAEKTGDPMDPHLSQDGYARGADPLDPRSSQRGASIKSGRLSSVYLFHDFASICN